MDAQWETMLGYCMTKDGRYGPPKRLSTEAEFKAFLIDNVEKHYELRIVDLGDMITFQVIDRELVFPVPEDKQGRNRWDAASQRFIRYDIDNELQIRINPGDDGYFYLDTRIGHYGKFKSTSRHPTEEEAKVRASNLIEKHKKELENAKVSD